MKPTEPKFYVGQMAKKSMSVEPGQYVLVSILQRRWDCRCWWYYIEYSNGATSWVLESRLVAPIGAAA